MVRNGFASFHIVVTVPPPDTYLLYVATNPLNACRVNLYREHFVKTSRGWIPDTLTEGAGRSFDSGCEAEFWVSGGA